MLTNLEQGDDSRTACQKSASSHNLFNVLAGKRYPKSISIPATAPRVGFWQLLNLSPDSADLTLWFSRYLLRIHRFPQPKNALLPGSLKASIAKHLLLNASELTFSEDSQPKSRLDRSLETHFVEQIRTSCP